MIFSIAYKSHLTGEWVDAWHLGRFTTERRALHCANSELPGYEVRIVATGRKP